MVFLTIFKGIFVSKTLISCIFQSVFIILQVEINTKRREKKRKCSNSNKVHVQEHSMLACGNGKERK